MCVQAYRKDPGEQVNGILRVLRVFRSLRLQRALICRRCDAAAVERVPLQDFKSVLQLPGSGLNRIISAVQLSQSYFDETICLICQIERNIQKIVVQCQVFPTCLTPRRTRGMRDADSFHSSSLFIAVRFRIITLSALFTLLTVFPILE